MDGCVYYQAGEEGFEKNTVIDPENRFSIEHAKIASAHKRGSFKVLWQLSDDFHIRLLEAIEGSATLTPREKRELRGLIGA